MTAAKIIAAWRGRDGYRLLDEHNSETTYGYAYVHRAEARLAKSGQRAIWPDPYGPAVIEDPPTPPVLPGTLRYWYCNGRGGIDWVGGTASLTLEGPPIATERTWTARDGTRRVEVTYPGWPVVGANLDDDDAQEAPQP